MKFILKNKIFFEIAKTEFTLSFKQKRLLFWREKEKKKKKKNPFQPNCKSSHRVGVFTVFHISLITLHFILRKILFFIASFYYMYFYFYFFHNQFNRKEITTSTRKAKNKRKLLQSIEYNIFLIVILTLIFLIY